MTQAALRDDQEDVGYADLCYLVAARAPYPAHDGAAFDAVRMSLADLRATEGLTLDQQGFALIDAPSVVRNYNNGEAIHRAYYSQAEAIVMQATDARRVIAFEHDIHAGQPSVVHSDYTDASGPIRARAVLKAANTTSYGRRYAIVSLWRPIEATVEATPIAVAAADSISPLEVAPQSAIDHGGMDDAYPVRHAASHRWFYAPRQTPDEALLLKAYDSATDGRARFTPHAMIDTLDGANDAPPSPGIETRLLVLY